MFWSVGSVKFCGHTENNHSFITQCPGFVSRIEMRILCSRSTPLITVEFNSHWPRWGYIQACVWEARRHDSMLDIGNRCVPRRLWLRVPLAKRMSLDCLSNQQMTCLRRKQGYSRRSFSPSHCWGSEIFGRVIPMNEPAPKHVRWCTQPEQDSILPIALKSWQALRN